VKRVSFEETALFRAFDSGRLDRIRPYVLTRNFGEGEYLYYVAEPAEYLWAVGSGEVRTLRGSANGRITTLELLHPGDLFGMAAMTEGGRYAESAQGVVAGEAWFVPRRALISVIDGDPGLGRALLSIVARRLQSAHDRLCSFAHDSVTERMARALLEAWDGTRIEMTRRILGESAGTTVETAIRVLRRFERAGWIEGGVGWIRVRDRNALARVARGEDPEE
jgi:CRP-like cAMP-binding protein